MKEVNHSAQKAFSKIGFVYAVYSILAMTAQIIAINICSAFVHPSMYVRFTDIQMLASSVSLHVTGLIVLTIGLSSPKLVIQRPHRHAMSPGAFLKAVCMCYTLLILSNLIGTFLTAGIGMLQGKPVTNPVEQVVMDMSMPVMFTVMVVGAPIFEELFFRKFLIDRTLRYGEWLSALLSGFMFGLFHGNLSQFPYAFALGIFFAFIYIRTGHIGYAVALHAVINFLGSIVGSILLKNIDLEYYTLMRSDINARNFMQIFQSSDIKNILLLAGYEAAAVLLVAIGSIFWILESRKIRFKIQEQELDKGTGFKTGFLNFGMLLYTMIWILMIVFATI